MLDYVYQTARSHVISMERLNDYSMEYKTEDEKIELAKKCMVVGGDPGKRSTFTLCYLLNLFLL